jgi:hypothetical protein
MIITLTQDEIQQALIADLQCRLQGIQDSFIHIDFTAGRKDNGITASITISNEPITTTLLEKEVVKEEELVVTPAKKIHKPLATKEILAPVEVIEPEIEVVEEDEIEDEDLLDDATPVVTPKKKSAFSIQENDEDVAEVEVTAEPKKKARFNL